ncbi:hypothetical protein BCR39DRAFT_522253 [Naematelia encephala]|uniref:Prokaryotic-type class I peptide chain release factors domain-containing protein n=1 Tax=Naematelia encephala TaxID=71784 RepID=A0A1Y2BDG5_9TREE|nr:hypothetical protein BCR39DRAFT_522253 [Naematelia encephala]
MATSGAVRAVRIAVSGTSVIQQSARFRSTDGLVGCSCWVQLIPVKQFSTSFRAHRQGHSKQETDRVDGGDVVSASDKEKVGLLEDEAKYDDEEELDGIEVDQVPDEALPATLTNLKRPRLPTSMKKLNRILGSHRSVPLPDSDLLETFVRGRGPGGQAINKTNSSVSLIHLPTGIRVQAQPTRSREENRKAARKILSERLDHLRSNGLLPVYDSESVTQGQVKVDTENKENDNDKKGMGKKKQFKEEAKELAGLYTKKEVRGMKIQARKADKAKKHKRKLKKKGEEEEAMAVKDNRDVAHGGDKEQHGVA